MTDWLVFDYILSIFIILYNTTGVSHRKVNPTEQSHLEGVSGPQLVKEFPTFFSEHERSLMCPVLSQIDPLHAPQSHIFKINFNSLPQSASMFSKWSLVIGTENVGRCNTGTLIVNNNKFSEKLFREW